MSENIIDTHSKIESSHDEILRSITSYCEDCLFIENIIHLSVTKCQVTKVKILAILLGSLLATCPDKELKNKLKIPVFHDDQHGTAIITVAGILNALEIVKKSIKK